VRHLELFKKLAEIEEHVVKIIERECNFKNVIYGNRARIGKIQPPIIWILPEDSPIEHSGLGEIWVYTFSLAAITKSTDPKKGKSEAIRLATDAASALVRSHTLDGVVRDIRRVRFLPGEVTGMSAEQLFACGYTMEVRFRYVEKQLGG